MMLLVGTPAYGHARTQVIQKDKSSTYGGLQGKGRVCFAKVTEGVRRKKDKKQETDSSIISTISGSQYM